MTTIAEIDAIATAAKREILTAALNNNAWSLTATATALHVTTPRLRRLITACGLDAEYERRNPGRGRPSTNQH